MAKSPFTRATVISIGKGRVVLREENGKYTTIISEPNPNIIVTVIDDDEAPCSPSKQTP
jgi:hypothetical protein